MRHKVWTWLPVFGSFLVTGLAHGAAPDTERYAQSLVDRAIALHPGVAVLTMHVTPPKTGTNVIIASNVPRLVGKKADADDLGVVNTGTPFTAVNAAGDRYEVRLPLLDANRRRLGSLGVVFPTMPATTRLRWRRRRRRYATNCRVASRMPAT